MHCTINDIPKLIMNFKKTLILLCLFLAATSIRAEVLHYSKELKQKLLTAYKVQSEDYQPRTNNICDNKQPCYINRLILESSPYYYSMPIIQ